MKLLRYLWVSPASLVGVLVGLFAIASGARARVVDGAIEVAGGHVRSFIMRLPEGLRFGAITLGHVIVGLDPAVLEHARAHEHIHVRQYEKWGLFFFPLYLGSSLLQLARGRDPYRDNCFEAEAFAKAPRP
jgi:hypothetical protein